MYVTFLCGLLFPSFCFLRVVGCLLWVDEICIVASSLSPFLSHLMVSPRVLVSAYVVVVGVCVCMCVLSLVSIGHLCVFYSHFHV